MFNLIKMDLHRMMHSISTWVMIVCVIGAAFLGIYMTNMDIEATADAQQTNEVNAGAEVQQTELTEEDQNGVEVEIGIFLNPNPEWANGKIELGEMIAAQFSSGVLLILISIFITLFVNAEQKNGFIKNIAGKFPNRRILVASRFASVVIFALVMFVVYAAAQTVFSYSFWGEDIIISSFAEMWKMLGVQSLIHLAFACFIVFFCISTGSSAFSMTVGIMICCGVGNFIYILIDKIAHSVFHAENFEFGKYMLEANVKAVGIGASSEVILRACTVGIVFAAVSVLISMFIMQKRDIR